MGRHGRRNGWNEKPGSMPCRSRAVAADWLACMPFRPLHTNPVSVCVVCGRSFLSLFTAFCPAGREIADGWRRLLIAIALGRWWRHMSPDPRWTLQISRRWIDGIVKINRWV